MLKSFLLPSIIYVVAPLVFHVAVAMDGADLNRIKVHKLHVESKLTSNEAMGIVRDELGYLWIGTDYGISRYDGYNFKNFLSDPNDPTSIGTTYAFSLILVSTGELWVGGRNLNRYHPETESFTPYEVTDGSLIASVLEGSEGIIWFGGEGYGLRGFDPRSGEVVHQYLLEDDWAEGSRFVLAMTPGSQPGIIWIATNGGIFRFNEKEKNFKFYSIPWHFEGNTDGVKDILVDRRGHIWLGTQKGVYVLDPESEESRIYQQSPDNPHGLSTSLIWSLHEDRQGRIWIGTDKKGVHIYLPEEDRFHHIPSSPSDESLFPPTSVDEIIEDEEGVLWFAMRSSGVVRISPHLEKFTNWQHRPEEKNGLGFNNVLNILEDGDGHIWVATDGGGLYVYDPDKHSFTHFNEHSKPGYKISSDSVISLAEDFRGNIWAGTWAGGINIFDGKTGKVSALISPENGEVNGHLRNNNIFRIEAEGESGMWVSVWRMGLDYYSFKDKKFTAYVPDISGDPYSLNNNSVHDVARDYKRNTLWVAGTRALEYIDLNTHKSTRVLADRVESANSILLEADALWVGTAVGLYRINIPDLSYRYWSSSEGLSDNHVSGIEMDANGMLWLSTRSGLNRFNPDSGTFTVFDERDGLTDSQFNNYSHLASKNGLMFFGGPKGVNIFNPNKIPKNESVPNIVLTDFEVLQNKGKRNDDFHLGKNIDHIEEIALPYDFRDIAFQFSALNFISPSKNKFKYRLLGLEREWTEVDSSRRRVRYTNLAPGKYTFHVQGSNNDGRWNREGKKIKLIVLPPWWMTWWFRLLVFVSVLAVLYGFIHWRLMLARHQKKLLTHLVKEKTAELEKANLSVGKLNSQLEDIVKARTDELIVESGERKMAEKKLYHMAYHDSLTGLPNRAWLLRELETLINGKTSFRSPGFALMFFDGDRFKQVNDTHGHLLGDELLIAVGERIKQYAEKEGGYLIRLGGDEFTLLLTRVEDEKMLAGQSQKVLELFESAFYVDQYPIHFKVSLGAVFCPVGTYLKPIHVLRDADIAMYEAKNNGRSTWKIFDKKMREQAQDLASLENDLYSALSKEQFSVVYQPIVKLDSGHIVGFEALLRWNHHHKGFISPVKFIPLAEDSGLIVPIGLWVLGQACKQLSKWRKQFDFEVLPSIAVNISALQLSQLDIIETIDSILDENDLDGSALKLEITESVLMENTDSVNRLLGALGARNIEIAIDDFGTGYSSLSYLDKLPVEVLKIDKQFISPIDKENLKNAGTLEIVAATISLAHSLNMRVVAEGIETKAQYAYLMDLGCDFGQGYYMARPMSNSDVLQFLEAQLCQPAKQPVR